MKKKLIILSILVIVISVGGYYYYTSYKEKQYLETAEKFKWDCYVVKGLSEKLALDISTNCACVISCRKAFNPFASTKVPSLKGRIDDCSELSLAVSWRISFFKKEGYDKVIKKYLTHMDSCLLIMEECPSKYEYIQSYFRKAKENVTKLSGEVINPSGSYFFYAQTVGQLESEIVNNLKQTDIYM